MRVGLRVLSAGSQQGKILPINLSQFIIGRDPECHLRPGSPAISKRHCAILIKEGKVFVRDFDSTNGTLLNDNPVKGEVEVKHKDKLVAGPLSFEILVVTNPAAKEKKPAPAKAGAAPEEKANAAPEKPGKPSAPASSDDDESVADLLLSMAEDDEPIGNMDGDEVPEGSTVMEMLIPPELQGEKKDEEKDESMLKKEKEKQANTSSAAKDLLEKYMRRPRQT